MRVLAVGSLYPPHHFGGYELLWQSVDRFLRARGHEVRILASDFRLPDAGPEEPDVHRDLQWYWEDHAFPRKSLRERLALERHNAAVFDRHVAEFRPDAVCWWAMGGMSLSLVARARRAGLPATGVIADDWLRYGPRADAWTAFWRRIPGVRSFAGIPTRPELRDAARWLFISDAVRRSSGYDGEVAHPGIRDEFTPRAPQPWGGRLLYAGRIDPRKGIDTAMAALSELPGATLTIDGDGDPAELARLRGLAGDRVIFAGRSPREALPGVYGAADALVFPVRWAEPYGLVPLEAMAVGRPVIGTGLGGSGEYMRDGENCLLVAPDDPSALAGAVQRLAEDEGLRERLRAGGLATAASLPEDAFSERVEQALLAVLGQPREREAARQADRQA